MADYEKKEDKALDEIDKVLNKFDTAVDKEDVDYEEGHKIRGWWERRRAIHDIKKIMHEAGKYDKFDEKEYDQFVKDYDKAMSELD